MHVNLRNTENTAVISLSGRFDFNVHRDFKRCSEAALQDGAGRAIEVDLGAVEYLDSSALGMLLLLREQAEVKRRSVALVNCRGPVKQILEVANFGRLFTIR